MNSRFEGEVTYDNLRQAIASVPEESVCSVSAYEHARAEAWKASFKWRYFWELKKSLHGLTKELTKEYILAMDLIRSLK